MSVVSAAAQRQQGPVAQAADAAVVSLTWQGRQVQARKDEFILRLDAGGALPADQLANITKKIRGRRKDVQVNRHLGASGTVLINAPDGVSAADLQKSFKKIKGFRYVEPNFVYHADLLPNDPLFGSQYGLNNTGQSGGTPDADIDAPEAWDVTTGDPGVVVGVIDSGVKYDHPDLAANMWRNPGEVPGNGIDDDADGFIDDYYGYDFLGAGDSDPMDVHGHGTHVSGTVAAVSNNGVGVAGVAWNARIMALRFLDNAGNGDTDDAIEAIDYAIMQKSRGVNIRVLNASWGGPEFSSALRDAIVRAGNAGILFVAAAGNSNLNTDSAAYYPASYRLPNLISVAATDRNDAKASFSNYGPTTVDLAAPGVGVVSTAMTNGTVVSDPSGYKAVDGTSMATPHVAGVAALGWGVSPTATVAEVRAALLDGGDAVPALSGITVTGRRLNARGTLQRLGLTVASTTPAAGATLATRPVDFVVRFSDPVVADPAQPGGVQPADLLVNGRPADAVVLSAGNTVATFHYDATPVATEGLQTMRMALGAVRRAADNDPVKPLAADFRYDLAQMSVAAADPPSDARVVVPMTKLRLDFSEPYDPSSIGTADLTLTQGTVTGFTLVDADTVEYALAGLTGEAALTVTLAAGAVADQFTNPVAAFTARYNLDRPDGDYPGSFVAAAPAGSLAAWTGLAALPDATASGFIGALDDADDFLLALDSGQSFSVFVSPSVALRPTVSVYDELGHLIGSATAPAAGSEAILEGAPAVFGGVYRIRVASNTGVGQPYTVRAVLNATEDRELHGGPATFSTTSAQDLDPAFAALPLGGTARQAAVLGQANGEDDYYGFTLAAGQAVSLSVTPRGIGSIDALEVYGAGSSTPMAVGLPTGRVGPSALSDRVIDRFVAPSAGRYYVRVNGYGSYDQTPYELVATRGAAIDREPDDSIANARPLSGLPAAVGHVGVKAGAIDAEKELNDDTSPGGGPGDLPFANDLTNSFVRVAPGSDDFVATVRGTVAFANDNDWDFFRFRANPGDALSVRMTMPAANAYLHLFDNRGVEVAANDNGGGGTNALLQFSQFAYAGDYYIVADTADASQGDYTITATLTTTQPPGGVGDDDYYALQVNAGDVLTLRTATPGGDSFDPVENGLDPRVELYGPGQGPGSPTVLLAFDDNGAPDTRNARLTYAALTTGTYYVRVLASSNTAGRYVLSASGATGSAAPPPLTVAATNPANGTTVGPPLGEVRVDFSGGVSTVGLNAAGFTVDGRPATGYQAVDGDTISFILPALASGTHQIAIAAGAVTSISGVPLTAYAGQFTLDANGPRVVASSLRPGDTVAAGSLDWSVQFDEPINTAVLNADAFRLTGAIGGPRAATGFNYNAQTRTLVAHFTGLSDDAYTLTLLSGDPWVEDALGNDMDGEATAWPLPAGGSGDGTPGGSFSVRFFADGADGRSLPTFQARSPVGSAVYESTTQVAVGGAGDVDELAVALEAGQVVQLVADPAASPGLLPVVELIDPTGASVGSTTAPAPGRAALLLVKTGAAGTYRVRVSGSGGTTGVLNLRTVLNAAAEAEPYRGGAANGSRAAAQNIDGSFTNLPGPAAAAAGAARGAVLGSLAPASVLQTVAADDFESGGPLGPAWSTWSSDAAGRIRVTAPTGPNGGTGALWMDRAESSNYALNEAVWTVDLRGVSNPVLSFDYADYGDERDPLGGGGGGGHINGDGVLVSTDGLTWVPVWVPQFNTVEGVWNGTSIDLAAATASAGLSLNAVVRIKFQQYDDSPITADGRGWDNVAVKAAAPGGDGEDWYAFTTTAAAQPVSVVLGSLLGTGSAPPSLSVHLFGESGAALASGAAGASNVSQAIANFTVPAAGTYYVRVSGAGADYSLSVLKSAAFDLEPNDSAGGAQDLAGRGSIAGYLGIPSSGLGAGAAAPPQVAFPSTLTDGGGFDWTVIGDGSISDGSLDAYDGALVHDGFPYDPRGTSEDAGREFVLGPRARAASIQVTRKVYVPRDQAYARFLEIVTNTGTAAADYRVSIQSDLGSDGQEVIVGTSSGDAAFTTADDWIVTDDADGASDPTLLHVIGGAGGAVRPSSVAQPSGALNYAWDLHLAPGETRVIMHFASQNPDRATALARAPVLRQLGAGALAGMSDAELRQVANFALANPRDYYARSFNAGQLVSLQTFTPGDAPGGADNTLNARLEVYDPGGQLVASDDNSAPDGRNARLAFVASTSGTYTLVVSTADGERGEYVLDLAATSPAPGAPGRPDLAGATDTGVLNGDDVTSRNNASAARRLVFVVPGAAPGALVTLYADGHAIGSATAAGEQTIVSTNGTFALGDGDHVITARQTRPGQAESGDSLALRVTVDTAAPSAPTGPADLRAASDSGASSADNVTAVNRPTLDLPAPAAGQYYRLYDNGVLVGGSYDNAPSFTPAAALPDGTHAYTLRAVDAAGNESADGPALAVTVDTAAPRVAELLVAGSSWSPAFLAYLEAAGLGTGGYRLPTGGAAQLKALPWTNLDQVKIRFTEPLPLTQAQLALNGTVLGQYAVASFNYDASAGVGTWTLAKPVGGEKLRLSLAGALADAAGNALDGNWADAAQAFPSGDGAPGGAFSFRLNVLPGDGSQDGTVSGTDSGQVRVRLSRSTANPGSGSQAYSPLYDFDGNGRIDVLDYSGVLSRMNDRLPPGEPTPASETFSSSASSSSSSFGTERIALDGTDAQTTDELKAALA